MSSRQLYLLLKLSITLLESSTQKLSLQWKIWLFQIGFKKLDLIRRKILSKFGWFLVWLPYHIESSGGGRWLMLVWLYGQSCPRRSYLGLFMYMHMKRRFLKSHYTGYEYFKDSLIVYMDTSCFDLTVAFSNKNNNNKKMEKSGFFTKV